MTIGFKTNTKYNLFNIKITIGDLKIQNLKYGSFFSFEF